MNIGRNDPCPCGSGKKYKKCCLEKDSINLPSNRNYLVNHIRDWFIENEKYENTLTKYLREYYGDYIEDETVAVTLMDALIFEEKIDGKIILGKFIEERVFDNTKKALYQRWIRENVFSFFEVQKVNFNHSLILKDLRDNKEYLVHEWLGTLSSKEKEIIICRIVPYDNNWMVFSNRIDKYEEEAGGLLKKSVNKMLKKNVEWMTQLEFIKSHAEKTTDEDDYEDPKEMLKEELEKRNVKFDLDKFEKEAETNESLDHKTILDLFKNKIANKSDAEFIMNLIIEYWTSIPFVSKAKERIGTKERSIVSILMDDVIDQYEDKKFTQKESDEFIQKWLDTPQPELDNKIPREIILEERKSLGNNETRIGYSYKVENIGNDYDDAADIYNEAIDILRNDNDPIYALELFMEVKKIVKKDKENQQRWFLNVGICLAKLGYFDTAKKYFQKSLDINPKYKEAQENINNILSAKTNNIELGYRSNLLDELFEQGGFDFSNTADESNDFFKDIIIFLNYLNNNQVKVSAKLKQINIKFVLEVNKLLTGPDAEYIVLNSKKDERMEKNSEIQYKKFSFLRDVLTNLKYIQVSKNKLILTKKGSDLLNKKDFSKFFNSFLDFWLYDLDLKIFFKKGFMINFLESFYENIYEYRYLFLHKIFTSDKVRFKDLAFDELKAENLDEKEDKFIFYITFYNSIEDMFLSPMIYLGFIEEIKDLQDIFRKRDNVKIIPTKSGKRFFAKLEENMKNMLPEEAWEI